ncbi:mini-circle putative transposase for IS117 [Ktedonobacter sp. SOSP1-52]|uniref:IS110 family transposase n=1 Tax=Ktedonobacter sp. SOSP1-52 TaxID=2778366 RepID=UPI00191567E4|nr:IS110 family transposase [Ktedonobacter sp. SOSP1-52]GHO61625.1 mini-circle putative transposase for IS117 [Ktedonobacter sp. SOSP1-52]
MWFAGIDWADQHHDVVVIDEAGRKVAQLRVEHTPEGLNRLITFLRELAPLEQIACILETNRGLLITALLEAGCILYPVNPKTVDRKRSASGAKTDLIDAYLLAKHGRSELADLRRLEPDSPTIAELKALTRDQDSLIQSQTRLVNRLSACLKAYYPVALQLFTKLHQRSALVFLQTYPTPQAAMSASLVEIEATLKKGGHTTPTQVASKIFATLHQPHLQADSITTRTKARLTLALIEQLLPLVKQLAEYDKAITDLFLTHADHSTFASLPGAGKRLAPRLLAEWGDDRQRYDEAASIAALAGTSPVPYESGNYARVHQRFACIKPLRNAFYQFAWQSTQQEAWAREYYDRKRKEGKSHSMAIRALANVWVRIVFAMWRQRQSYQRNTFEAARHLHARRAA